MLSVAGCVIRDDCLSGCVHFLKYIPDTVSSSFSVTGCEIITVFVEHIEITVLPAAFAVCKFPPCGFYISGICNVLQICIPVGQHIPVALGKQGESPVDLRVSGKQMG